MESHERVRRPADALKDRESELLGSPPTSALAGSNAALALQRSVGNRTTAMLLATRSSIAGAAAQYANPPTTGTLPTREQLDEAVDRSFREFFPDAPKRLDPNDPEQADLVSTWVGLRDGILNEWTDRVFFAFFPNAPKKLDPSNSPS